MASINNVMVIKNMLRCFKVVLGLKVNFYKSRFGVVGVKRNLVESYSHLLNCKLIQISFNYLGLPIGANPRKEAMWQPIVLKSRKKLPTWSSKTLSMAGRACLINFVLTSLPSREKVKRHTKKIFMELQGGRTKDKLTQPKEYRGLRIKNITMFNEALLAK
uniref:Uncharacterized protein n=1 Tax=Cajanus cajan TaxID=3821 RepID=A0A151TZQ6_CAJCA|nr:hypothetical protein KK1_005095 [Cajanus cajan]